MSDEQGDSGASMSKPIQTSTLKKGSYVLIKGRPCKVNNISTSKPGKHGSAKCNITAIDIFTGKKLEEISPAHANLMAPEVKRKEFCLQNIEDGFLELWDDDISAVKDNIRLPENEIGTKIKSFFDNELQCIVTVLIAMGEEMVIECKDDVKGDK